MNSQTKIEQLVTELDLTEQQREQLENRPARQQTVKIARQPRQPLSEQFDSLAQQLERSSYYSPDNKQATRQAVKWLKQQSNRAYKLEQIKQLQQQLARLSK